MFRFFGNTNSILQLLPTCYCQSEDKKLLYSLSDKLVFENTERLSMMNSPYN